MLDSLRLVNDPKNRAVQTDEPVIVTNVWFLTRSEKEGRWIRSAHDRENRNVRTDRPTIVKNGWLKTTGHRS